ncbi:cytochrome P450 [Yimella sp. cx-51]|uniref:cytochrome P450 n=1 Tax=Yimella sp. cx-51 TaxID=2770551 RepID=UPI00165DB174|nr:cytochrome P450 [Yimella sp. cx-51]MBC9957246.1 cytochrome P450 [Yimella sp. cx-51]QTH37111.1 cytochrome P450 [Yimella sp. cx-51]
MTNPLSQFVNWLREGYPEGVPPSDYSPLLAVLQRSLTDNEIEQVVTELRRSRGAEVDTDEIRRSISEVAHALPTDEDVERVSRRLESAGWRRESDRSTDPVDASHLGFEPQDLDFIADPYPVLTQLRAAGRAIPYAEREVWLIPHFADVHQALRSRALGRSFEHRHTPAEFGRAGIADLAEKYPRFVESERWSLLNLEPPDHTRIRRLVTKVFTAKAIREFTPRIEALADAALARIQDREDFDLVSELAQPYSISVICELLGVPQEHGSDLLAWSHAIVKMYEIAPTAQQQQDAERAAGEFIDFVSALIEQRRATPGTDLISELVMVADEGDRLSVDEIVCTVIVLLNAGHEATVNTLGNGMNALLQRPQQWVRVAAQEVDALTAVEEMLRFDPPLQMFERWVLEPVELAGRQFGVGERIAMLFGSANRDPQRFEDADTFDVGRGDGTHIGFGAGVHFCIGAPLARAEISAMVHRLATRPAPLRLVEVPTYHPTFVIRGLRELRVSLLTPPASRT